MAIVTTTPASMPLIQGVLTYVDTTHLKLSPKNGGLIFINGLLWMIPSAGVTVDTTGLSTSTFYYVYAKITSNAIALELSATAHATDSTYGHRIKSGDGTRTLVGWAYTNGSTQFTDSDAARNVRSLVNDPGINLAAGYTTTRANSSTSYVVNHSEMQVETVVSGDEYFDLDFRGFVYVDAAPATVFVGFSVDASSTPLDGGSEIDIPTANSFFQISCRSRQLLSAGRHTFNVLAKVNTSVARFGGNTAPNVRCMLIGSSSRR